MKFPIHAKQIMSDIFLALSVGYLFGGSTFRLVAPCPGYTQTEKQNKAITRNKNNHNHG